MKMAITFVLSALMLTGCNTESETVKFNCADETRISVDESAHLHTSGHGSVYLEANHCNSIQSIDVVGHRVYRIKTTSPEAMIGEYNSDNFTFFEPNGNDDSVQYYYNANSNMMRYEDGHEFTSETQEFKYIMDKAQKLSSGATQALEQTEYNYFQPLIL